MNTFITIVIHYNAHYYKLLSSETVKTRRVDIISAKTDKLIHSANLRFPFSYNQYSLILIKSKVLRYSAEEHTNVARPSASKYGNETLIVLDSVG